MTPRADFSCLSKKCRTEEGAPVYELPIDAKVCPVCGSKRLTRLFNAVAVIGTRAVQPEGDPRLTSSSHFQRSQAMLQPMYDAREARQPPQDMRSYTVPVSQLAGQGKGRPMTETEVGQVFRQDMKQYRAPTAPSSVMKLMNRQPIPTEIRGVDR